MSSSIQKETLKKTLAYLSCLHDEFVFEIETKTVEIKMHHKLKAKLASQPGGVRPDREHMRAWRRKSFALHERRSRLKTLKDALVRQMNDVKKALEGLECVAGTMRRKQGGIPMGRPEVLFSGCKAGDGPIVRL